MPDAPAAGLPSHAVALVAGFTVIFCCLERWVALGMAPESFMPAIVRVGGVMLVVSACARPPPAGR